MNDSASTHGQQPPSKRVRVMPPTSSTATSMDTTEYQGKLQIPGVRRSQTRGYIVFSREFRKIVKQENPECDFGEISRLVGTKWQNLDKEEKEKYKDMARKMNEEHQDKQEAAEIAFNESLSKQYQKQQQQQQQQQQWTEQQPGTPGQAPRLATPAQQAHHRKKQEEKKAKECKEQDEALMQLQQQSTPLYQPRVPRGGYSPRGPRNMARQHQGPVGRGSPGVNSGVRFDPYKRPVNYGNHGPSNNSLTSVKNELDDISNQSAENTGNQLMRENINVKTESVNEENLSGLVTSNMANSQGDIKQEGLELGADFTNFMSGKSESDSNVRVKLEAVDNDLEIKSVEGGQPMQPQDWSANVSMGTNFDPTGATGSQADMTGQQGYIYMRRCTEAGQNNWQDVNTSNLTAGKSDSDSGEPKAKMFQQDIGSYSYEVINEAKDVNISAICSSELVTEANTSIVTINGDTSVSTCQKQLQVIPNVYNSVEIMPNTTGESDKIVNQALPINNTPPTKIALKRKYDTRKTQDQPAASPEPSSHAAVAYLMNKNQTSLSKVSLSSSSAKQNGTLLQQKEQELECKNCHEKYSMIKAFSNHLAIEIHLQNECLKTMIDYEPVFDSKYLSEQFKKLQVDFEVMECTCKSILLSQAEFNSHLKRGRCEKDLKCPFDNCSKSFGPCSDWNMHVKEYHGLSVRVQKQLYGCGACDKIVETKLELEKHRNSGFHPNHVLCCGRKFSYERDYNSHRSSDHDFKTPLPSIYNCEQLDCDFTCFDERFLQIHMNTCHFQELFQCNFDEKDRINNDCYRIFKTEADWYKHLDQHVSVGFCTFCKASLFHKCYWKKPKLMHIDPKSRLACQYTTSFCKSLEETVFETVQETGSVQSETYASHDQHEQSGTKQASKEATIQNTDKAGTTAADDEKTLNVTTQQKESNQTVQNNFTDTPDNELVCNEINDKQLRNAVPKDLQEKEIDKQQLEVTCYQYADKNLNVKTKLDSPFGLDITLEQSVHRSVKESNTVKTSSVQNVKNGFNNSPKQQSVKQRSLNEKSVMDIRSTSSKEDTENYPKILPEHMKIPRFMKVDEHCYEGYEGVSDIDGVTYDDIYRLIPSAIRKSFFQPNFLCTVRNCNNLSGSEIKHESHHSDKHPSAKCSYSCLNADAVAQMYEKTFYPFQSMFYCNVRGCNFLRFLPSMSDHFPQELKAHSDQHDYSFVKDENHCEKSCNSYFVCTACDLKLRTFQHYALHGNVCKISKNNNRLRAYIFKQCSDGCETTLCPVCSQGPFNETAFEEHFLNNHKVVRVYEYWRCCIADSIVHVFFYPYNKWKYCGLVIRQLIITSTFASTVDQVNMCKTSQGTIDMLKKNVMKQIENRSVRCGPGNKPALAKVGAVTNGPSAFELVTTGLSTLPSRTPKKSEIRKNEQIKLIEDKSIRNDLRYIQANAKVDVVTSGSRANKLVATASSNSVVPQPPHNDVNPTETETIKIYMIKPLTDSLSSTPDLICVDADSIELRMDTLSTQSAPDNYAHDSINMREETFKIVKQTSKTSILSTFEASLLVPSIVSRTGNALNGSIAMRYIPTVVDEQKSNTSISSSKESYLNVHRSTAECSKTSETSMLKPSIVSPMGDLSCAMNILPVKTEPFESGMYAQAISSTTKNAVVETSDQLNSTHVSESSHDSLSWLNSSIFKEELLVDDVTTGQYVVQIYKVCDDGEIKVEADS